MCFAAGIELYVVSKMVGKDTSYGAVIGPGFPREGQGSGPKLLSSLDDI